ncbi:DUF262 domain-containing protein [Mycoplasmopsis columboralis]|uniref:Uncharacterized conserved protein n=1 Tax=Mycoplasmopsis columboralis TaxID=171282 RepID=A0A449B6C2_9BACT|nr:DUF262 domain-containing protein [Mycoplasmopsis columboralis]VEU76157.1 Uncharacterized conserved protein [Mycoplasmopsis columboralis]
MTTKSKNSYENLSAIEALNKANTNILLIPDIQRDYVWDVEDIESLFDSIVRNFPIGSFIFFKTTSQYIRECKLNLYSFFHKYRKSDTKNQQVPKNIIDGIDRYIVIDGQQRLTSLNIGLYGYYEVYKGGRGKKRNENENWAKKELYYNMRYYDNEDYSSEDTAENSQDNKVNKRFVFLEEKQMSEKQKQNFIKIKEVIFKSNRKEFIKEIEEKYSFNKKKFSRSFRDLEILRTRLHEKKSNALVHYYSVNENDYNNAVDIFIKTNGSGKKLSKSDLIFSALVSYWPEGKEKIDSLLKSINGINVDEKRRFNFSRDYLILACLILLDKSARLKISDLTESVIEDIQKKWEKFEHAFNQLVNILKYFKLEDKLIPSYNATIPVLYFIFKTSKFDDTKKIYVNKNLETSKFEIFKYLIISFAKNLFGMSSSSSLDRIRNILNEKFCKEKNLFKIQFTVDLFDDIEVVGLRNFKVDQEEIERWIRKFKYNSHYSHAYMLLKLLYRDLDNFLKFDLDHCHPKNPENGYIGTLDKIFEMKRNIL